MVITTIALNYREYFIVIDVHVTYVQTDRHTITILRDGMIINYYQYFCLPGVASTMVKRYNLLYMLHMLCLHVYFKTTASVALGYIFALTLY